MNTQLVRDTMTTDPIVVASNCTLPEAYWLMIHHDIRRLLVVDGEALVGIVTLEDLRRMEPISLPGLDLLRLNDLLSKMPVRRVMSPGPITISPEATLIDAARLMLENKISTLPVIADGKVVGIITESDIFRAFVESEHKIVSS